MAQAKYIILVFSDDGRSWLVTRNGKPAIEPNIRPVDLENEDTRRLEDYPNPPGKGVYFFNLSDNSLTRAPAPALRWADVLQAAASED